MLCVPIFSEEEEQLLEIHICLFCLFYPHDEGSCWDPTVGLFVPPNPDSSQEGTEPKRFSSPVSGGVQKPATSLGHLEASTTHPRRHSFPMTAVGSGNLASLQNKKNIDSTVSALSSSQNAMGAMAVAALVRKLPEAPALSVRTPDRCLVSHATLKAVYGLPGLLAVQDSPLSPGLQLVSWCRVWPS